MDVFQGQNILEFSDRFKSDEDCKEYLSNIKSNASFKCTKCNHTAYQVVRKYPRQCNICRHIESSTVNMLFHKVKFGVRKAFFICFEMATSTKSLSASYMAVRYGVTKKKARLFMLKVREAMASLGNNPMKGNVHVDEFVLVGKETSKIDRSYNTKKKKAVTAVQLTEDEKLRIYTLKIKDFSTESLQYIFVNHMSRESKMITDKWKGYIPIAKAYDITQIESNGGLNFKSLQNYNYDTSSQILV